MFWIASAAPNLTDAPVIDGERETIRPDPLLAPSPAQMPLVAASSAYPIPPELLNQISGQIGQWRKPSHIREGRPPTPRGYEWRRDDDGWNLWQLIANNADGKRWRFVGHFPQDQWQAMRADAPAHRIGFTSGGFRAVETPPSTADSASLGSIPRSPKTEAKTVSLGSIPKKAAKPLIATSKAEKLPVAKSRGNQDSWTVAVDKQTAFRIRLTESGYAVVLRWSEPNGKRPERYCCYLSKREWADARKKSLSAFAELVAAKIEPTKDDLIRRVQSLAS